MQILKSILTLFRFLLIFNKPYFNGLDFIPVIIDNKPILLLTWHIENAYEIAINPLNARYKQRYGCVLLYLPPDVDSVEIIIQNIWKKTRKKILLKRTFLDEATALYLVKKLSPLTNIAINNKPIVFRSSKLQLKHSNLSFKPIPDIRLNKKLKLNTEKFHYNSIYEQS